jgi:hypothetical protein
MNPPTTGHEKLMDVLSKKSGNNPYKIYLTQTTDAKKNPLDFKYKVKTVRKFFPKHARNIMLNKKVRSVFDAATEMYNEGFKNITMVVGSDRINEFNTLLKKYNGVKSRHGLYNFNKINVISAGDRDPDADDISGMSASKMRSLANEGDFTQFSQGLPRNVSNTDAKKVYNEVRRGMGLKEQKDYFNKLHFEPVSEKREAYVQGHLYDIGDRVTVVGSDELASITSLGSNYVIVESNSKLYRKWLTDIELFEKTKSRQDTNINDKPSIQPASYFEGLNKTTKDKRDSHFKKHVKMFGEDAVEAAKKKIEREKLVDKMKHARMLDRAKVRKIKNRSKANA